jgi:CRISPR/Cas system-associated protein Cas10 (large subunit of type III CRISPR-Cas system)
MKNNKEVVQILEAIYKESNDEFIATESFTRYIDRLIDEVRKQERDKMRTFLSELNN